MSETLLLLGLRLLLRLWLQPWWVLLWLQLRLCHGSGDLLLWLRCCRLLPLLVWIWLLLLLLLLLLL